MQKELSGISLDGSLYLTESRETGVFLIYERDDEHPYIAPKSTRLLVESVKDTKGFFTVKFMKV